MSIFIHHDPEREFAEDRKRNAEQDALLEELFGMPGAELGGKVGKAVELLIRRRMLVRDAELRELERKVDALQEMCDLALIQKGAEQISDAKKLHAVLEHAAVKLARNEPLFSEIPTMQEYNEQFRQKLVRALCEVLRALEQSGQGAEKTAVSEKVLRTYTSG